jgi:hypothetical protein
MSTTRQRRTFAVEGLRIEVEEAPPRKAFRGIARAMTILGPALAGLVARHGVEVEGKLVSWQEIVQGGGAVHVFNALLKRLGDIDPDDVEHLLDELAIGQTWIHVPGAQAPIHVTSAAVLDAHMPSGFAMIGLLRFVLEVNLRPILPVHGTDDTSSAGKTSSTPAVTP